MSKHEIVVGNYTTKHFYMCGSAQKVMRKNADKDGAEELTRLQDEFFALEKEVMDFGQASEQQKMKATQLYDKIMTKAEEVGIAGQVSGYMKMHLNSVLKGNPEPGFGRTDLKESLMGFRTMFEKAPDTKDAMKRYKSGKAGFTDIAHLKAKGLIKRADGSKKKSDKYEEVLDEKIAGLVKKSDKSGIAYGILKKVYDRGMAAWRTGHRPGTTPQQWAFARVNSFITGGGARKSDNDLWQRHKGKK